jgi:hypothetical protein
LVTVSRSSQRGTTPSTWPSNAEQFTPRYLTCRVIRPSVLRRTVFLRQSSYRINARKDQSQSKDNSLDASQSCHVENTMSTLSMSQMNYRWLILIKTSRSRNDRKGPCLLDGPSWIHNETCRLIELHQNSYLHLALDN